MRFLNLTSLVILFCLQSGLAEDTFQLSDPGQQDIVNYDQFGVFSNLGTADYRYFIKDREGLSRAVGEGIYPNVTGLLKDPSYQKMHYQKQLVGSDWDFVNSDNLQANFYKWASTHDQPGGLKEFYVAMTLAKAGLYTQA